MRQSLQGLFGKDGTSSRSGQSPYGGQPSRTAQSSRRSSTSSSANSRSNSRTRLLPASSNQPPSGSANPNVQFRRSSNISPQEQATQARLGGEHGSAQGRAFADTGAARPAYIDIHGDYSEPYKVAYRIHYAKAFDIASGERDGAKAGLAAAQEAYKPRGARPQPPSVPGVHTEYGAAYQRAFTAAVAEYDEERKQRFRRDMGSGF